MLRFNNLSIGTKLAVTSGLSVLLVIGMLVNSMYGNSVRSRRARELACRSNGHSCMEMWTEYRIRISQSPHGRA